jgi:hypothetical protein
VIDKESLKIKTLEQVLIEKSVNFFGTCSEAYRARKTSRQADGNPAMVIGGQLLPPGVLGRSTSSLNHQASDASQPSPAGVGSWSRQLEPFGQ